MKTAGNTINEIVPDLVLRCGPTLQGEFVHSLTVTDVHTGWTENMAIKNGAHRWVIQAMTVIEARLPFPLVGLDTDNGGEFINHALIKWAGDKTHLKCSRNGNRFREHLDVRHYGEG